MFLHAGNFDSLKCIELNAAYGIGNYVPGFYDSNYPSNRSYSEFLIKLEGSVYKQGGIIFTFNRILKTEKGFGCCECWPPKNYSYRLKGYYGSLSLYLNWKYFGFKYGFSGLKRDRGFCEEDPNLKGIYPSFVFKLGLINKIYLTVGVHQDIINYPLIMGAKYHFSDYYSQIWIGKANQFIEELDLYFIQIKKLMFSDYTISIQGHTSSDADLKGIRVGISYLFQWPG